MKTSKKILIGVGGVIIALLITTLFMLRRDIKILVDNQSIIEYKTEPVEKFNAIDFSPHWIVSIKQGKNCKVELDNKVSNGIITTISTIEGTLYVSAETDSLDEKTENIRIRITAPTLKVIQAAGDTKIEMKSFFTDSVMVILKDSSTFIGSKNTLDKIIFKASAKN